MNFFEAVKTCFTKYATFSGRAKRPEFWYWTLFVWIVAVILSVLDGALFAEQALVGISPLGSIFVLVIALPGLAVGCRRLHDIGRSGWWQLLALTGIGYLVLLWWWISKGEGDNAFGPAE